MPSMDAKDLERTAKDLLKAASQPSASPQYFTKTLEELESKVDATEELLRATKIGVAVNKLKQLKDPDVVKRANDLVNKWRKDIKLQAAKDKHHAASSSANVNGASSKAAPVGEASSSTSDASAANGKYKSSVPLEKRSSITDAVDTKLTGNDTRDGCLRLMYDGLAFMSEDPPAKILSKAKAIEIAAYAIHPATSSADPSPEYRVKVRSLFQNLKNKSNTHLRSQILDGSLQPQTLVRMSSEDLKSDKRREEDEKMQKENMDKAMVAQEQKSISTSLQCSKCKQRKVSYSQAQTRSADEPMTTFCECTVCGNRWKFS